MAHLLLKPRTIVRVTERGPGARASFIARIVGTDMFATKYELGVRYCGWGEYRFLDGGTWASPDEVEPLATDDVPFVAALCSFDGVPIILYPEGIKDVRPGWEHAENEFVFSEETPEHRRAQRMYRRHKVRPEPHTSQTADVWDIDDALARKYVTADGTPNA
jgi:hypothetical protein